MRAVLGVDPGKTGAVAFLGGERFPQGHPAHGNVPVPNWVRDMPIRREGKKFSYDVVAMRGIVEEAQQAVYDAGVAGASLRVVVETTNAFPNMGRSTLWQQAWGIAIWQGLCVGMGLQPHLVHANTWTAALGIRGSDKAGHLRMARDLYPDMRMSLERQRDHGRADAILVAEWGRGRLF